MKNRINLYTNELRPRLELVTLNFLLFVWLLAMLALSGVYMHVDARRDQAQINSQSISAAVSQQNGLVIALRNELSQRSKDPVLVAELSVAEDSIRIQERILSELSGRESQKQNRFSHLLLGLAENHKSGMWLTGIQLDGSTMSFTGKTTDSAIVPIWLTGLKDSSYFAGQEFEAVHFFRDSDEQLNFQLGARSTQVTKTQGVAGER